MDADKTPIVIDNQRKRLGGIVWRTDKRGGGDIDIALRTKEIHRRKVRTIPKGFGAYRLHARRDRHGGETLFLAVAKSVVSNTLQAGWKGNGYQIVVTIKCGVADVFRAGCDNGVAAFSARPRHERLTVLRVEDAVNALVGGIVDGDRDVRKARGTTESSRKHVSNARRNHHRSHLIPIKHVIANRNDPLAVNLVWHRESADRRWTYRFIDPPAIFSRM